MDQAFENWWTSYAYPKIVASPGGHLIMRHITEIKQAAKECWNAAWQAASEKG